MKTPKTAAATPQQETIRLNNYRDIAIEQTKQAKIKARMEKSIAGHQYTLARLGHKHRMIEAFTWTCLVGGFSLAIALLFLPAVYAV